jgi:hypothetical protein
VYGYSISLGYRTEGSSDRLYGYCIVVVIVCSFALQPMHTTNDRWNKGTNVRMLERTLERKERTFVRLFVRSKREVRTKPASRDSSLVSLSLFVCACACARGSLSLSLSLALSLVRVLQRGKNLRGKSKRSKHAHWAISIHA